MKEKIKNLIAFTHALQKRTLVTLGILGCGLVLAGITMSFFSRDVSAEKIMSESSLKAPMDDAMVAIVGILDSMATGSVAIGNSWPGEIVSPNIAKIQPQRDGVITDWRVRIGERVVSGQVLGKISAPPATPELIAMLADRTEARARAEANAKAVDTFTLKEQARLGALANSLTGAPSTDAPLSFAALETMRKNVESKKSALRSFIERALSSHVGLVSGGSDWQTYSSGNMNRQFGILDANLQSAYDLSLRQLIGALKSSSDVPILRAEEYFGLAVQLANKSWNDEFVVSFKAAAMEDQKDFLEFLSMYREAQAELADKETEYKTMISEKSSMLEKDRAMAHADASAAEVAYATVIGQVMGESYIRAPRSGVVSAIYKKVGDLVAPDMFIAVIAGDTQSNLMVRMHIPSNVKKPAVGEILSVVRPGFPNDVRKAKLIGVGTSLDEVGAYMADAVFIGAVDWPSEASVRVIAPESSSAPILKFSAVWWGESGAPYIWGVSDAGRIFAKKITIGRTLGDFVEVSEGVKNGEGYIAHPTPDVQEDMLLEEIIKESGNVSGSVESNGEGHQHSEGMQM